jgi:hypothetical protein
MATVATIPSTAERRGILVIGVISNSIKDEAMQEEYLCA